MKLSKYVSTEEVRARQVKDTETVVTFAGSQVATEGDYVVETSDGNLCVIEKDVFEKHYTKKAARKSPAKKAATKKTPAKKTFGNLGSGKKK